MGKLNFHVIEFKFNARNDGMTSAWIYCPYLKIEKAFEEMLEITKFGMR